MLIIWKIHITQDRGITPIFLGEEGKEISTLAGKTIYIYIYKLPHIQNQRGYKLERKELVHRDPPEARVARMEGELATLKTSSQNVESQLS